MDEIEPFGWVINASLAKGRTKHPLPVVRTRLELPYIQQLRLQLVSRTRLVLWYREAPIGEAAFHAMAR